MRAEREGARIVQHSRESERKGRSVLKPFLSGYLGVLFGIFVPDGTQADDLYPEITPSKTVIIGNVIYLWGTLKHSCGAMQRCSGSCTYFAGFYFQQVATCARLCTEIPAGMRVKQNNGHDMVQVSARNSREGEYLDCRGEEEGSLDSGVCPIGSATWEGSEYQGTNRYCVKIKNWDAERARDFSTNIEIEEIRGPPVQGTSP